MFSSQRVLSLDSLFCYPIMFSVNHAAIFVWIFSPWFSWFSSLALSSLLESTPLSCCSASTASWNVATRPLSVFSLYRRFRRFDIKLWPLCSTDSFISTLSLRRFTATNIEFYTVCWHDSLLLVDRHHHWLSTLPPGDSLSCQSHRRSQHRHHPHHRPSCILRAPHPSETHACRLPTLSSRSLPPSALQPRLYGASHLKSPSAITASSTTSRRPRVHPAPHHRLLVSALFAASFASSTSYASLSSAAIAGHSRAR